jgi:hypothetical protein
MTTLLKKLLIPMIAGLALATTALAQPGPGMGGGPGMGRMGGGGPGAGWRADTGNTPGYVLMTEQERLEHQNRLRSMKTYQECSAYVSEHRAQMATRAQEKGTTLRAFRNPCDMMKSRGWIK